MKKILMTGLIIFVICTIGCSSNKSNADKARTIEKTEATTKRAEQAAPQPEDVIIAWNSAHSMHDADKLKDLYADVVFFYNYLIERELCIKDKARLFQKNPEFSQTIGSNIIVDYANSIYRCQFDKNVIVNGMTTTYESYLYLKNIDGKLKIIREGDKVTDDNIQRKSSKIIVPLDHIVGDFDGDGCLECAWLDEADCYTTGKAYLRFNKSTLTAIPINTYYYTTPDNLSDLNNDGADEIGISCTGAGSAWMSFNVFSFMNGKWTKPLESWSVRPELWEDLNSLKPVEVVPNKDYYVNIYYSENDPNSDDFMATKKRMMPIAHYNGTVYGTSIKNSVLQKSVSLSRPAENNVRCDFRISAKRFCKDFSNNELAADKKYRGKLVEIYGEVRSIGGSTDAPYITIDAGFLSSIWCYFNMSDVDELSKINKGKSITIVGTYYGDNNVIDPNLGNCKIVSY